MLSKCLRVGCVLLAMACGTQVHASGASAQTNVAGEFDQVEQLQKTDHSQSLKLLALLNKQASYMTSAEQWRLRYLNAWEATYRGDYARANPQFRAIIASSGDAVLATKAASLLLSSLGFTHQYTQAYELADRLVAGLPGVQDVQARFSLLFNLSLTMDYAGQYGLAGAYARMMESAVPPGETLCRARNLQMAVMYDSRKLKASNPELQRAIDMCMAAKRPVYAHALWLMQDAAYLDEGQPGKALALLERIGSAIEASGYYPQIMSMHAKRAMAYASLGRDGEARTAALNVLAMDRSGGGNEWLRAAYKVLYEVAKRQGYAAAALGYYEKYTALDKAYLGDVNARTLAYETVQQHVLAQKLETEQLARQNASLRLQQQLAAKTAEANRLYIALLALALGFGVFVMVRLKRSQLRYRRLSRLDGLTELLNRQHFMGDAERVLQRLHKRGGAACLAYLDLDHFKRINDTHGHAAGDVVLREVVTVCQQQLRLLDLFGRLGGEEFGILLVDATREQALAIANRIRQAVAASKVAFGASHIVVSTSIGLAFTEGSGHDLQRLCMDADAALYLAKDSGRNCVVADGGASLLAPA